MKEDWFVWPLFISQLIAFILIWIPDKLFFGCVRCRNISFLLLFAACLIIVFSLYNAISTPLTLYF